MGPNFGPACYPETPATDGAGSDSSAITARSGPQWASIQTRPAPTLCSADSTAVSRSSRTLGGTGEWTVRMRRGSDTDLPLLASSWDDGVRESGVDRHGGGLVSRTVQLVSPSCWRRC